MNKAYLLFGGNMGDRFANVKQVKTFISKFIGNIIQESNIYETEPWGFEHNDNFLNQVVLVETDKSAQQVLSEVLKIELLMGRERSGEQWKSRSMDIDILFFNKDVIDETNLIVPHHYLHQRKFALVPMSDIDADYVHPKLNKTITQLISELDDNLEVKAVTQ